MKNADYAHAFREAIPFLANSLSEEATSKNKIEFVCHAISYARQAGLVTHGQEEAAKQLIRIRLRSSKFDGSHGTLSAWMTEKIGEEAVMNDQENNDQRQLQATRLAWLESLVAEFSVPDEAE